MTLTSAGENVAMPASRPGGARRRHDRARAALLEQVRVLLLVHGCRDDGAGVELADGQDREDRGVVAVDGDDDRARVAHVRLDEARALRVELPMTTGCPAASAAAARAWSGSMTTTRSTRDARCRQSASMALTALEP